MKKGFTLAEVLITLGIIGVVASMTIPTLIQKVDERETISKANKAFNTLKNAVNLAIAENGSPDTWDINYPVNDNDEEVTKLFNYIRPYISLAKDCETSKDGCMYDGMFRQLNGENKYVYSSYAGTYKILLNDGTSVFIRGTNLSGKNVPLFTFYIDVNNKKGPNQVGYDVFFTHLDSNGINLLSGSSCSKTDSDEDGSGCLKYIIINKNMDYLKE